ncbi:MAG: VOC family protein [Nocardioidaceae bacterium]
MALNFQVTFDSTDPHTLADWWADALGWEVEPSDEAFIREMIAQGHATDEDTVTHRGVLVWKTGAAIRHPDPDARPGARILFQQVPEAKTVKNRLHLDVRLAGADLDSAVSRLTDRGATVLHHGRQGPHTWITLVDPEGNEFCLG